jgi:cell division protein FtsQ
LKRAWGADMGARRKPAQTTKQSWFSRLGKLGEQGRMRLNHRLVGGVMLLGFFGTVSASIVWFFSQPTTLPIQRVQIAGEFHYLTKEALYEALGDLTSGGFFNVDVRAIKQAAEALPWVDRASVRRLWPDALQVKIDEQTPLAVWRESGKPVALVNERGELFRPHELEGKQKGQVLLDGLAAFSGPKDSALAVTKHFARFNRQLVGLGLKVTSVVLSNRRAWEVQLDNGIRLMLGRGGNGEGLTRFAMAYAQALSDKADQIAVVDLRYTNGFAVRWKNTKGNAQGLNRDLS